MEAELTGESKINSKIDNFAVTEEENIDEAITAKKRLTTRWKFILKKN